LYGFPAAKAVVKILCISKNRIPVISRLRRLFPLWCLTAPPFPRCAGAQQSSEKHFSQKLLYIKHGLLSHRLRGEGGGAATKGGRFSIARWAVVWFSSGEARLYGFIEIGAFII
jgi:hypothetical protein